MFFRQRNKLKNKQNNLKNNNFYLSLIKISLNVHYKLVVFSIIKNNLEYLTETISKNKVNQIINHYLIIKNIILIIF